MRFIKVVILSTIIGLAAISAAHSATPQGVLIGNAIDLESGQKIYVEEHRFFEADGEQVMRTRYLSPEKLEVASREVFYAGEQVARYQLNLRNIQYEEAIDRKEDEILIRVDAEESKQKSLSVDSNREVVIDAGFNDYILRNWTSLIEGKKSVFDFASTAQLDIVSLQVTADKDMTTDQVQMFSMTAANPIFRLLMKPIKAGYYKDTKQLAYYRGVSNLKDDNGDAYKVEITFDNNQLAQSTESTTRRVGTTGAN